MTKSSRVAHIPLPLECLEISKLTCNRLIGEIGFILLQKSATCFCVLGFRDRVFDICLLYCIERDYDAVYLRKRVV